MPTSTAPATPVPPPDEDPIELPTQVRKETRLLDAAETGNSNVVRNILRKIPLMIDVNAVDKVGQTALAKACKGGYTEIVELLLLHPNIDTSLADRVGVTPLHRAAIGGHTEVIKHLVLAQTPMDAVNKSGTRPIDHLEYRSPGWTVMKDASSGIMPEIDVVQEVPIIPDYAIARGEKKKKKKGGKKKGGKKKGKKKR